MRHLLSIIITSIVVTIILHACADDGKSTTAQTLWPETGNAKIDSLMNQILQIHYAEASGKIFVDMNDSINLISSSVPENKRAAVAACYVKYKAYNELGKKDSAKIILTHALSLIDSVSMPREYNILKLQQARDIKQASIKYNTLINLLNFFESTGDSIWVATTCKDLGMLWKSLNDPEESLSYYTRSHNIWKSYGFTNYVNHNLINIANALSAQARDSIYDWLRTTNEIAGDTSFRELVMRNSFLLDGNPEYIKEATRLSNLTQTGLKTRALNYALTAQYFITQDQADSALYYGRLAAQNFKSKEITPDNQLTVGLISEAYNMAQQYDSANMWIREYVDYGDTLTARANLTSIYRESELQNIQFTKDKIETEYSQRHTKMIFMTVIVILMCITVTSFFYALNKRNKLQKEQIKKTMEYGAIHRQTLTSIISEQQTEVDKIRAITNSLLKNKEIAPEAADKINKIIQTIEINKREDEVLVNDNHDITPQLMNLLKVDYPKLSERQLKLAGHIVSGVSTQQMARLLNISVASVNTARYRLRMALSLDKDESLDAFLRAYVSKKITNR